MKRVVLDPAARGQEQVDHLERIQLEQALEARTIEITLNSKHGAVGRTLKELQLPHECVIISVRRGPCQLIPRGYTRLLSGDRLIALATEAGEVHPGDGGMAMVCPMPVVVQPEPINRREKPVVIPKGWSYVSPGCSDARGTSVAKPWGTSWK